MVMAFGALGLYWRLHSTALMIHDGWRPARQGDEAVKILSGIVLVLAFAAFCFFILVAVGAMRK